MENGEEEDGPASHLVEVDVLVAGEEAAEPRVAQARYGPPEDQQQQQRAVQVQTLATGPGAHLEQVGVAVLVGAREEEPHVGSHEEAAEGDGGGVVPGPHDPPPEDRPQACRVVALPLVLQGYLQKPHPGLLAHHDGEVLEVIPRKLIRRSEHARGRVHVGESQSMMH